MADRRRVANPEVITTQRARLGVVLSLLATQGLSLALVTGVPAVAAAAEGEWRLASALGLAAIPPLAAFLLQRWIGRSATPRKVEALFAVALAFLLASLLAMPAFVVLDLPPAAAFFEAVSGITTTGLSAAPETVDWPVSAHFLRAWLQWVGGFAFAVLAIALVVGPGVVAMRLGLVEKPGEDLTGSARSRARPVLSAYVALTLGAVGLCALAADAPLDGIFLAMSAVSTGGVSPGSGVLAEGSRLLQALVAAAVLLGAVSMTLLAVAWREGASAVLADRELRWLLGLVGAASVAVVGTEALTPDGVAAWDAAFTVVSAQSTAGFSTVPVADLAPASLLLLVLVMAIGGSLGSTAGGIKVFRLAFAAAVARMALTRASLSPNAVSPLRVFGRVTEPAEGTDVFALFALHLLGYATLWFALLAAGFPPLAALFDTVSAFSTVGLSAGVANADLPEGLMVVFAAAMLLGRLEFIAFIALLRPQNWLK